MIHSLRYSAVPTRIGATGDVIVQSRFWRIIRFVFFPGTTALNFRAGIWHTILVAVIVGFWAIKDPPFTIEFNKMWAKQTVFPDVSMSTVCNGTDYDDVFEWFDCTRKEFEGWQDYNSVNEINIYNPVLVKGDS